MAAKGKGMPSAGVVGSGMELGCSASLACLAAVVVVAVAIVRRVV